MKVSLTLLLLALLSTHLWAKSSQYPSTVPGISIGNTHQLDEQGKILRGRAPSKKITELKNYGITDVLIFKNQTRTEVDNEMAALAKIGIKAHHIPFRWQEIKSLTDACLQTMNALWLIKKVKEDKNRSLFFHCTAGEDRTGMLAGLYRVLFDNYSAEQAFQDEMCAHGYSSGNPNKPYNVVSGIRKELTPLYLLMADYFMNNKISPNTLELMTNNVCAFNSTYLKSFRSNLISQKKEFICPK